MLIYPMLKYKMNEIKLKVYCIVKIIILLG